MGMKMKVRALALLFFLWLLFALPASASITFVQTASNSATSGTTVAVTITTTGGNQLVLCSFSVTVHISSISSANSWAQQSGVQQGSGTTECWTPTVLSSTAETSITVTYNSTIVDSAVIVGEYSGALSYGLTNTASNASTTTQTISITTQDNNNFVVAGLGIPTSATVTIQTGTERAFKAVGAADQLWLVDNTSSTPASVTCSTTTAAVHAYGAAAIELRTTTGAALIGSVGRGPSVLAGPSVRN